MKRKTNKRKSVITARIMRSTHRLTMAVLVLLVFAGVLRISGTNAGFSDSEMSNENIFSTLSLDGKPRLVSLFSVTGMAPGDAPNTDTTFKNVGTLDFQYGVKFVKVTGDDALCDALILTAKRGSTVVYDHLLLKDFDVTGPVGSPFVIPVANEDKWNFTVELPADADATLEHKSCQWSFDFTAWQTNLPDASQGFSDVESVTTHSVSTGEWLTAGDVVINEVMWMGSTVSTADEWIELKNMTAEPIDIGQWKIANAKTGPVDYMIPANKVIPAHGYFLIANYPRTSANTALDVAPDVTSAGLTLHNINNGNLVLKSADGLVIDSALGATNWPAGTNNSQKQSMERNDIPGDGLLAASWHACVSGAANGAPYWDAVGNNYGTPKAANLSPVVLNEFVPNPTGDDSANRPNGEWIELYNILSTPIDVAGWYFTNADGDKVMITDENTASGDTVVPGEGALAVYLEQAFIDNDKETLSLMNPLATPLDESDDVVEDVVTYEGAAVLPEGKSFARFPDGAGIWLDPESTPGKDNKMSKEERDEYRLMTFDACFENEKLKKDATDAICSPAFLVYLGMLKELDDHKIDGDTLLDVLALVAEREAQKLAALLEETKVITSGDTPTDTATPPSSDETAAAHDDTASSDATGDETSTETPSDTPASDGTAAEEVTSPADDTATSTETAAAPEETATPAEEPANPPKEEVKEEPKEEVPTPKEETPAEEPAAASSDTSS